MTEGRRFLELALAEASDDVPSDPSGSTRSPSSASSRPKSSTSTPRSRSASARSRRSRPGRTPPQVGLAQATLALAVADAGDVERGGRIGRAGACHARGRRRPLGVRSRPASSVRTSRQPWGTSPRSPPWRRTRTVTPKRSGSTHSASRRCCSMRGSPSDRTTATPPRTRTVAHSISRANAGFADHVAFALSGLASCALASGDLRRAEELERRALATAEAARAAWAAAHARVGLGRILAAAGDTETAARLYRNVLEWSKRPRQHGPRESLFLALAEDPARGCCGRTGRLGDARAVDGGRSRACLNRRAPRRRVAAAAGPTAAVWQRRRPRLPCKR